MASLQSTIINGTLTLTEDLMLSASGSPSSGAAGSLLMSQGAGKIPTWLNKGSNGQILSSNGISPVWITSPYLTSETASSTYLKKTGDTMSGNLTMSSNKYIYFNGGTTYYIATSGINLNGQIKGTSFYATSDRRLKENIVPFEYKHSILDIPVKSFNFKSDEKKQKTFGFIAQELQEVYPELVSEDESGYLSINENKLVYLLMEELKLQNKKITELEKRLDKLERGE